MGSNMILCKFCPTFPSRTEASSSSGKYSLNQTNLKLSGLTQSGSPSCYLYIYLLSQQIEPMLSPIKGETYHSRPFSHLQPIFHIIYLIFPKIASQYFTVILPRTMRSGLNTRACCQN